MRESKFPPVLIGAFWSLGFAILWTTLAAFNPTTNYHLSPLITALAAPLAARLVDSGRLRWPLAITTVGLGVTIAVAAAIMIDGAGWAPGPSFSADVSPRAELVAVILIGAVIGTVIAIAPSQDHTQVRGASESEQADASMPPANQ
ncbi:MAG: hypothetical protein LH471_05740 [Salinibacterium sp.]|nr:hypothetical protein [Salinibacterium sp.]